MELLGWIWGASSGILTPHLRDFYTDIQYFELILIEINPFDRLTLA